MSISCKRTGCKHNKNVWGFGKDHNVCKRGSGYDYPGGDITISVRGYCQGYEKRELGGGKR